MQAPLSSAQKTEILKRQAFACAQCQRDLEPVGSAPPHFVHIEHGALEGAPIAAHFQALCALCSAKSGHEHPTDSDEKKRHLRDSGPAQTTKKFVKSGFDTRKF